MLLLSAIGIAGFVRYVHGRTKPFPIGLKRTAQVGGIALVAWSILANLAIAFSYSFSVGDSAAGLDRYLAVQDAAAQVIGPSLADRTIVVDSLAYDRLNPIAPGTLAIIGDCEALYLSNGEPVDTWTAVEYGNSDWRTRLHAHTVTGHRARLRARARPALRVRNVRRGGVLVQPRTQCRRRPPR